VFDRPYDEHFSELPHNFHDDLSTKPEVQRSWLEGQQRGFWGYLDHGDHAAWRRHLDYYAVLHQLGDDSLGTVLDALERAGRAEDTVVIFTSDHGDMCGSHGLRSKGPFVYQEVMNVPLYVVAPGLARPGTRTDALASHVDLATTIARLAGAEPAPEMMGVDLSPVLSDPGARAREHVLFAQDSAWFPSCQNTRYALRGIFDGRTKYVRYYGIGGGITTFGQRAREPKLVPADSPLEDQEHELYDLQEDPGELVNLAHDGGRRAQLRAWFDRLRAEELEQFARRAPDLV